MKAWIANLTGEYFHTDNNDTFPKSIATQVKPRPSIEADNEIKIQKEMTRLLREQAIKNLGLKPEPIITDQKEPT